MTNRTYFIKVMVIAVTVVGAYAGLDYLVGESEPFLPLIIAVGLAFGLVSAMKEKQ